MRLHKSAINVVGVNLFANVHCLNDEKCKSCLEVSHKKWSYLFKKQG